MQREASQCDVSCDITLQLTGKTLASRGAALTQWHMQISRSLRHPWHEGMEANGRSLSIQRALPAFAPCRSPQAFLPLATVTQQGELPSLLYCCRDLQSKFSLSSVIPWLFENLGRHMLLPPSVLLMAAYGWTYEALSDWDFRCPATRHYFKFLRTRSLQDSCKPDERAEEDSLWRHQSIVPAFPLTGLWTGKAGCLKAAAKTQSLGCLLR